MSGIICTQVFVEKDDGMNSPDEKNETRHDSKETTSTIETVELDDLIGAVRRGGLEKSFFVNVFLC